MPTVLLVRHGQASFGAEDYDVLSPVGVRQAELVGAALARRGIVPSRVVSGSMRRQLETAAAFAAGDAVEVDERWNEYDPNEVLAHHAETRLRLDGPTAAAGEGMSSREFQAMLEPALRGWIAAGDGSSSDHSWPRFAAAGAAALDELAGELRRGETAIVCSSGGTIAAVCAALMEAPEAAFPALNRVQVNTGVTKIVIGASGRSLVSINDHSHLEETDRALITYR